MRRGALGGVDSDVRIEEVVIEDVIPAEEGEEIRAAASFAPGDGNSQQPTVAARSGGLWDGRSERLRGCNGGECTEIERRRSRAACRPAERIDAHRVPAGERPVASVEPDETLGAATVSARAFRRGVPVHEATGRA